MPLLSKTWAFGQIPPEECGDELVTYKSGAKYPKKLLDALQAVQSECHAFLNEHVDPHPKADLVHLWLLGETLMNAIGHGNELDPQSVVEVTIRIQHESADRSRVVLAELHVFDEGDEFDPNAVPDPTLEENRENPTGRGLQASLGLLDRRYGDGSGSVRVDPIPPTGDLYPIW